MQHSSLACIMSGQHSTCFNRPNVGPQRLHARIQLRVCTKTIFGVVMLSTAKLACKEVVQHWQSYEELAWCVLF